MRSVSGVHEHFGVSQARLPEPSFAAASSSAAVFQQPEKAALVLKYIVRQEHVLGKGKAAKTKVDHVLQGEYIPTAPATVVTMPWWSEISGPAELNQNDHPRPIIRRTDFRLGVS
ncbi:hypothetical protein [Desulfolithobacter sp.]